MALNKIEKRTSTIQQRVTPTVKKNGKAIVAHLKKLGHKEATEADMLEIAINDYKEKISQ